MLKNRYLLSSVTLGVLGGIAALLIGLTDLLTSDKIQQNEIDKVNSSLAEIFPEGTFGEEEAIDGMTYVTGRYAATKDDETFGYVYQGEGKNSYGSISLLVGIYTENYEIGRISLLSDGQTFATTLEENYLDAYNAGHRELEDVTCGATYGATLIKNIVKEAQSHLKGGA